MHLTKLKMAEVLLLAVGVAGGAGLVLHQTCGAEPPPLSQPQAAEKPGKQTVPIEAWNDLATLDDVKAARAITILAKAPPQETVAFLKERLQPVSVDAPKMARFIENLDAEQFAQREQATENLRYLGKYAAPYLRKALEGNPGLETRQRLEKLLNEAEPGRPAPGQGVPKAVPGVIVLGGVPGPDETPVPAEPGPSVLWLRAVRAISILEHIGPAGKEILKDVAGGEPEALPTREARAALERLGKQTP